MANASSSTDGGESRSGTQAVERAVRLLHAVAACGDAGARLTDLVASSGLSKPTTRRLLAALVEQHLLSQNEASRRYYLGVALFSLGALAGQRLDLRRLSVEALVWLTEQTQDTVFLSMPDGRDSLCIARYEGQFPIRTLTMSVGDRRPMGVGAGSLALLGAMTDAEVEQMLATNAPRYQPYGPEISPARLREKVAETRQAGYASSTFFLADGKVMPGMNAVGVPILTPLGVPVGAVSVATVPERLQGQRRAEVVALARKAAAQIAQATRQG